MQNIFLFSSSPSFGALGEGWEPSRLVLEQLLSPFVPVKRGEGEEGPVTGEQIGAKKYVLFAYLRKLL